MAVPFSGGTYVNTTFTGALRSDLLHNIAAQMVVAGWTKKAYSQVGGGLGKVATFTVTIATPGVVTMVGHGYQNNDVVILQTTGALPTGLSVSTRYFVRNKATDTFELSTTSGGASINTTGSQSGTHTLNPESFLLESATQANVTNPIRVRLKDNRLASVTIQVSIENAAGTVTGASSSVFGGMLLGAAAKTFRILATKYWFACFTPGVTASREYVEAGMLFVPAHLTGITDHGYMTSNASNDSDGTARNSWRNGNNLGLGNSQGNHQFIWNAILFEWGNNTNGGAGNLAALIPNVAAATNRGLRWGNDALNSAELLATIGSTTSTDEGKLRGSFYDRIWIGGAFAVDSTDTFAGHTWFNLSNNLSTGCIWAATS